MSVQTAMVGFQEVNDRSVWRMDVVVDGVITGHVYRGDGGTYRFFEGESNDVIWSFSDLDLERLQARITATVTEQMPSTQPA